MIFRKPRPLVPLMTICFGLLAGAAFGEPPDLMTNAAGISFIRVAPGAFMYGAPTRTERECLWSPRETYKVTITRPFYLGRCEVTQAQFERVMGSNPSRFKGPEYPVDSVTWEEAMDFCRRMSKSPEEQAAGRVYALPTSAEWEYACRAGSNDVFPWGNDDETIVGKYAWCRDWYGERSTSTHAVGSRQPNAWGFHDMLGNVWEWCADDARHSTRGFRSETYCPSAAQRKEGLVDPVFPVTPDQKKINKVIRGGGWNSDCRAVNCIWYTGQRPLRRDDDTGFRVKCVLVTP